MLVGSCGCAVTLRPALVRGVQSTCGTTAFGPPRTLTITPRAASVPVVARCECASRVGSLGRTPRLTLRCVAMCCRRDSIVSFNEVLLLLLLLLLLSPAMA